MDSHAVHPNSRLPAEITENLNPALPLRPYQQQALLRLTERLNALPAQPAQWLFHMATGSGKTLIMAGAMLHLYRLGYRRFLFFVNSSNIIEKTRGNFLNTHSAKYLFAPQLFIGNRRIRIHAGETFRDARDDELSIIFTTIQGLHSRLNSPRENSLHDADFEQEKTVFLSDEAHHINAETKKGRLSREESRALLSWENSVNRIFRAHPRNVLLEFTATADLSHPAIRDKYRDKVVFDYSLARFRRDGYSKEVMVLQSDLPPFERALQALLLSLYRQKIFERHGLHIKPVVLLKSKNIADSRRFFSDFSHRLRNLGREEMAALETAARGTVVGRALDFFRRRYTRPEELIDELRTEFEPAKCISVDSRNDSEEKQLLINSLEEPDNPYRLVFAVDKLNEGWDVLNLFDIVRLYDTRGNRPAGRPMRTTLSEAQLIGRGARYCPFRVEQGQPADRRKYDDRPDHPLRICELLYYHAAHNPAYIAGLNRALRHIGIREERETRREIYLSAEFQQGAFYREGLLFLNRRIKRPLPADLTTLAAGRIFSVTLAPESAREEWLTGAHREETAPMDTRELSLGALGPAVLRKAINRDPFFYFERIAKLMPGAGSIAEFINAPRYLGGVRLRLTAPPERLKRLTPRDKLRIARHVLREIALCLQEEIQTQGGSEKFEGRPLSALLSPATVTPEREEPPGLVWSEFPRADTGRAFLKVYERLYPALIQDGCSLFLLANRQRIKLYRFEDGAVFHPDFVLCIHERNCIRQIFIADRREMNAKDRRFLSRLRQNIRQGNRLYRLSGLVFEQEDGAFEKVRNQIMGQKC